MSIGIKISIDAIRNNDFPFKSDLLFGLDGTIITIGASKYFKDTTANGRNFLITNYDFDSSRTNAFPYKSAATISAPAADAILIAADINNFLYDSGGNPNQISVVSLFQDIDYAHKIFTKHIAQVINGSGVETTEPCVINMCMYANVKSGTDLTICQNYFGVPTEVTTNVKWVDANFTGTSLGTKAAPYKTLVELNNTVSDIVYVKSGNYDISSQKLIDSTSPINILGIGLATSKPTANASFVFFPQTKIEGFVLGDFNGCTTNFSIQVGMEFVRCKITKTSDNSASDTFAADRGSTLPYIKFKYCVINAVKRRGLVWNYRLHTLLQVDSCIGSFITYTVSYPTTNVVYQHNKFTAATTITESVNVTVLDNASNYAFALSPSGATIITSNRINANITTSTKPSSLDCQLNTVLDGQMVLLACNNAIVKYNYVHSSYTDKTTVHSVITLFSNSGGNITGVELMYNTFIGTAINSTIVEIGTYGESDTNGINGCKVYGNKIVNEFVGAGTGHSLFCHSGINYDVRYNDITHSNGHGIVVKAYGAHYTVTTPNICYNIFRCTGSSSNVIWVRGAYGVTFANNVAVNFVGIRIFNCDDNALGQDNSLLTFNNLITLSGTVTYVTPTVQVTTRNDAINRNGNTITNGIPVTDFDITTVIDSNGVPVSKVEHAEVVSGFETGLAANYLIPSAITYQTQAATWQNGAVILP